MVLILRIRLKRQVTVGMMIQIRLLVNLILEVEMTGRTRRRRKMTGIIRSRNVQMISRILINPM